MTTFVVCVLDMRRFVQLVVAQGANELNKADTSWLEGLMASQDRRLMAAAWKETMAFDSRPRLAEIACPTLVVAGTQDQAVPLHHAQMLHAGIRDSQLVVIAGAGHALVWTHPDELVQVTEDFLATAT
jgi:pimeloyl-ACP methyl ester carboxylesterase